jgi:hypothetical protein
VSIDLPAQRFTPGAYLFGVNRHYDALGSEPLGCLPHKHRIEYRGGVDAYLVRAGIQHTPDIRDFANATTHRERYEDLTGYLLNNVDHGLALIRTGRDIQKGDFIGALFIIAPSHFDRIG